MHRNLICQFSLFLLSFVCAPALHANGNGVGNGGFVVFCTPPVDTINPLSGWYSLDYLIQFQPELAPVDAQSLQESLDRIERLLLKNLPEVVENFRDFRKNIFNEMAPHTHYFWKRNTWGPTNLETEVHLVSMLPANCLVDKRTSLVQAVIRLQPRPSYPNGPIQFEYNFDVVHNMAASNPLQLSFLLVHEWLWNYITSAAGIFRMNFWLHSPDFDKATRDETLAFLETVEFQLPKPEK